MNTAVTRSVIRSISAFTALAVILGSFVIPASSPAMAVETPVTVTIVKYIDGAMATALNANSVDFPMSATWNDPLGIGAGTGSYELSDTATVPYEAETVEMNPGSDYATNEILGGEIVGETCSTEQPFALVGYTSGDTLAEAEAGEPTLTPPSFVGLTSSKYVIVWNHDCAVPTTVTVSITKFIDGVAATALTAGSLSFPMISTTTASNLNGGVEMSGLYELSSSSSYQAITSEMASGSSYATNEVLDGSSVGASCETDKPFALIGYTWGDTFASAATGTPSLAMPSFTNLIQDKYVIVWNQDCSESTGSIGGEVTGGSSTQGTLAVTSITPVQTTATADNTYENGWSYTFNITIASNEQNLKMKFGDWFNSTASSTLSAGGNMQISSAQADNGGAVVPITSANTYSSPALHMTGDLDPALAGMQVRVLVQVKVPPSTVNGSYTTTYGVQTLP